MPVLNYIYEELIDKIQQNRLDNIYYRQNE